MQQKTYQVTFAVPPTIRHRFYLLGGGGGSWAVGQLNTKCCKQTYKHIYTENYMRMSVLFLNLKKNEKKSNATMSFLEFFSSIYHEV